MKKFTVLVAACAMTLLTGNAWAQGGGEGRGSGMRNNPKFRLTSLVRGIGALERDKKDALSPAQAQRIVAAIAPWQKKPHMSDSEAKTLYMTLNSVLTTRQKNDLDKFSAQRHHFGGASAGGNGGGGNGPGGGRMGGGGFGGSGQPNAGDRQKMRQRMEAMTSFLRTMNPFYPPTNAPDRMREGLQRRYDMQKKTLTSLYYKAHSAKNKKPAHR